MFSEGKTLICTPDFNVIDCSRLRRQMQEQFVYVQFRPICVRLALDSDFGRTTNGDE